MAGPYSNNQSNPASAIPVYVVPRLTTPLGYQQVTATSAAALLVVPAGATMALVVAEAQAVRWRDDGVAPTAGIGIPLATGVQQIFTGDLAKLQFIAQVAGAILDVSYYA